MDEVARPLIEVAQECLFVLTGENGLPMVECMAKLAEQGMGVGTEPLLAKLRSIAKSVGVLTHTAVPSSTEDTHEVPSPAKKQKQQRDPSKTGLFAFGLIATQGKTSQGIVPSNKKAAPVCDRKQQSGHSSSVEPGNFRLRSLWEKLPVPSRPG